LSSAAAMSLSVKDGEMTLMIEAMTLTTKGEADLLAEQIKKFALNLPVRIYATKAKAKAKPKTAARPSLARAASEGAAATEAARD
jgi:hypothetical protein